MRKKEKVVKSEELRKLIITIEVNCENTGLTHAALNSALTGIYNKISVADYKFNFGWNDNGSSYTVKSSTD